MIVLQIIHPEKIAFIVILAQNKLSRKKEYLHENFSFPVKRFTFIIDYLFNFRFDSILLLICEKDHLKSKCKSKSAIYEIIQIRSGYHLR